MPQIRFSGYMGGTTTPPILWSLVKKKSIFAKGCTKKSFYISIQELYFVYFAQTAPFLVLLNLYSSYTVLKAFVCVTLLFWQCFRFICEA